MTDVKKENRLLATGTSSFRSSDDALQTEGFSTVGRLVDRRQGVALLTDGQEDAVWQGIALIYSAFANIVDYKHAAYRPLHTRTRCGLESAGKIMAEQQREI